VHFLREDVDQHEPVQPSYKQEFLQNSKKPIEVEGDLNKLAIDPRVPDRTMCIGAKMSPEEQAELLQFLDKNSDIFAWSTSNLIGVSREVIEYKLQVNPNLKPTKQKLCKMLEEKIEAAKAEVKRLLDTGFIRKVIYPQWLANIVMVLKKNKKW
jgi:hypothetical protein